MNTPAPGTPTLPVTVFSDYVCPFCYVGDARLDAIRDEFDLDVEWCWFEIHPDNPSEGRAVSELGYPPEQWQRMMDALDEMAHEEGLALAPRTFTTSSHKALLLAESAKSLGAGVFERLHKRLFHAYFAEARNIGDEGVLHEIAAECGIAPGAVARAWSDPLLEQRLHAHAVRSARLRLGGVPAFLIGRYLVPGAVSSDILRQAARAALAEQGGEAPRP